MSISGERTHDQQNIKVSVIGGGDLGMSSVMSILSKVRMVTMLDCKVTISNVNADTFVLILIFTQCKVDKLVFIDVAESSTKGGSTDLEIFSLPKVEVSKGTSLSALSHSNGVITDVRLFQR